MYFVVEMDRSTDEMRAGYARQVLQAFWDGTLEQYLKKKLIDSEHLEELPLLEMVLDDFCGEFE